MMVKAKYFAAVRDITGRRDEELALEDEATLQNALTKLSDIYGDKFRSSIYTPEEGLREDIMLLVNGEAVSRDALQKTRLKDGDVIVIMPPVGGGWRQRRWVAKHTILKHTAAAQA